MKQTANYQLNQYEPQDDFLRADFNANNEKLDAALKGLDLAKCEVRFGTYKGAAIEGNRTATQRVELGFTPKILFIIGNRGGWTGYSGCVSDGLVTPTAPMPGGQNGPIVRIENDGFVVRNESPNLMNLSSLTYHYFALV